MQLCKSEASNLNLSLYSPHIISASHPALRNVEVIHTISLYTHRASLPALASACRAFESPALDVLWKDLESAEPLVKCLPTDLFGIDQGDVVLQKPIDDKMWDTLSRYTSRVHSIAVKQTSDPLAIIEHLGLIMLSCPSTPASLFPKLRSLVWHGGGTRSAAEFLRMAFVPSLLYLDMQFFFSFLRIPLSSFVSSDLMSSSPEHGLEISSCNRRLVL
ncbi:hypothetical protein EDB19DRAFT_972773 [Suillus lakei]|nr:hypothetical protein EDB19DRAFT_972773 [Suillus lakei]